MIILLVGIALSAMVSTHQINITNIYPVVNEQYQIPIQELFNGRFPISASIKNTSSTNGAFSLSQQVYQQSQSKIKDDQNSNYLFIYNNILMINQNKNKINFFKDQNKISMAQQYINSNPNIPTGAYAYLGQLTNSSYFVSQFSYQWTENNKMTNSQISQDEQLIDQSLTSGYSCLSLYYININESNQIQVFCLNQTYNTVQLLSAVQSLDGSIGNFSFDTYTVILPNFGDQNVTSMKTQITYISNKESILSALYYTSNGTNIFAQYSMVQINKTSIQTNGPTNMSSGVVDFYVSINGDIFLLYNNYLSLNNTQNISISTNSINQALGVYNTEVSTQTGTGWLYYLSVVQQYEIQYLQVSINGTNIVTSYLSSQLNPANGTVKQCFLSPEFAVYISNKQAFAQAGPTYQQIYGSQSYTPYIWIQTSNSISNSSSYIGIYDLYNNLLILSTPVLPRYFQFSQAYLSTYQNQTGQGSVTVQAIFSDGTSQTKTINFNAIKSNFSLPQVYSTSSDENLGLSLEIDLNDIFVGYNLNFQVNDEQLQKVKSINQIGATQYSKIVQIPGILDEYIQIVQFTNKSICTQICSSYTGYCSGSNDENLSESVQQAQIDYNQQIKQYILAIQYEGSDELLFYRSSDLGNWIKYGADEIYKYTQINNFLFIQNQLLVQAQNELYQLNFQLSQFDEIQSKTVFIDDEFNPQNIWANPYTYGNLLFVDNGDALWIISLGPQNTVLKTIPYLSNSSQTQVGLLDQGIYIVQNGSIQFYQRSIINSYVVNSAINQSQQISIKNCSNNISVHFSQNKLYLVCNDEIYVLQASASSIGSLYTIISNTSSITNLSAITYQKYDISCYLSNQITQCIKLFHQQLINTNLTTNQKLLIQQSNLSIQANSSIANNQTSQTFEQQTYLINNQTNLLTSTDETQLRYTVAFQNQSLNKWQAFFSPNTFVGPIDTIEVNNNGNSQITGINIQQMVTQQKVDFSTMTISCYQNLSSALNYNDETYVQNNMMIMTLNQKQMQNFTSDQTSCQILFQSSNNADYPINSICYNSNGLQLTQYKSDLSKNQIYTYSKLNVSGVAYVDESVFMMYTADEIYLCFTYSTLQCNFLQNIQALSLIPFNLNISSSSGPTTYNQQSFGYIVQTSSDYLLYTMIYSYSKDTFGGANQLFQNLNATLSNIFKQNSQFYENVYYNTIQILVVSSTQINYQKFNVQFLLVSETANIQFLLVFNWSPTLKAFGATHQFLCGYAQAVDTIALPYASTINNLTVIPYQYANGDVILASYQTSNPRFGGNNTQLCQTQNSYQELTLLYYLGSTNISNLTFSQFIQNNQLIVQNSIADTYIVQLHPQYIITGTYDNTGYQNNDYPSYTIELQAINQISNVSTQMKINQVKLATYDQKNFSGKYLGIILGGLAFIGLVMAAICYQTTQKARDEANRLIEV